MVDHPRARAIASTVKKVVADALEHRLTDPRLGFVTVTDVRVTGDLQHASIFYTVLGSAQEREDTAAALQSASGRIRSLVGAELAIRLTPTLEFIVDAVPETAAELEAALDKAHAADERTAQARAHAEFAGDADPYKQPHDETE